MNVYLIKASAPGPFKDYKKAMGAPPQNIFAVAATTPQGVGIEMCDETIGMQPKMNTRADIVALFFHTPDAPHAYKLADKYRDKGKTVVLGGLHPSFLPDEAAVHADAVMIGEEEGIWEQLIDDYQNGTLKSKYQRNKPVDLATVKPYPTDIIPPAKYDHIWTVLVSRGCVHKCEFCTVPPFFCGKYRLRPIEQIVAEIKAAPTDWFELHADNLTADRAYALKLFKALKPLKINWSGEATIKLADDDELLLAAADSGCKWLLIGIETPSQAALKDSGKGFVDPDTIKDKISRFHDHGIPIASSMIFGFDTHTPEIFKKSEEFCRHIGIDEVESVLLIPFPGTPLYTRMVSENRLLTHDWSKYDGSNAVFQPANMAPEALEEGATWFWNEIRKKKVPSSPAPGKRQAGPDQSKRDRHARTNGPALTTHRRTFRWKSVLALGVIGIGLYYNWYWIWGALLLIWGITDLRNRHTYLLDDIPRSESPVLYWIVVLMWLTMGIWALSTAPILADFTGNTKQTLNAPIKQDNSLKMQSKDQNIGNTKTLSRIENNGLEPIQKDWQLVKNNRFGFSFEGPEGWEIREQSQLDNVTLYLYKADNTASITAIAVDYRVGFTLKNLIVYMEQEIQKELPFVKNTPSTIPISPRMIDGADTKMVFKQYKGEFEGEMVQARVGYAVDQFHGYSIIGAFGESDHHMQKIINRALTSFKLKRF